MDVLEAKTSYKNAGIIDRCFGRYLLRKLGRRRRAVRPATNSYFAENGRRALSFCLSDYHCTVVDLFS